jgi:hypothetical protein
MRGEANDELRIGDWRLQSIAPFPNPQSGIRNQESSFVQGCQEIGVVLRFAQLIQKQIHRLID